MLLKTHRFFALMYVEVSHADSTTHVVCTVLKRLFHGHFKQNTMRTHPITCNNESDCLESIKEKGRSNLLDSFGSTDVM